jgi:hypothetical protein
MNGFSLLNLGEGQNGGKTFLDATMTMRMSAASAAAAPIPYLTFAAPIVPCTIELLSPE